MNNIIQFIHPGQTLDEARRQACVWLVKLDAGASEEDLRQIRAWLDTSPEHAKVLLEVASMWDQVSVLSELSEIFPLEQYVQTRSVTTRKGFFITALTTIAMTIVMIGGGAALLEFRNSAVMEPGRAIVPRTYETMVGQQSTVILPDDSEIILNTNTLIEVSYSKSERKVTLFRGEGHFSVSKDASRPFRVIAGDRVIEAVGTAFAVQHLQQEDLEVTVTEGKVNLFGAIEEQPTLAADVQPGIAGRPASAAAPQSAPMSLIAGESVQVGEQDEAMQKRRMQPGEMEGKLAWRYGMLQFQGNPLEEVIKEVSRYTSIRIEVDDAVRNMQVFGYFRAGDIDGLLLTMKDTFHVNVERVDDGTIFLSSQ